MYPGPITDMPKSSKQSNFVRKAFDVQKSFARTDVSHTQFFWTSTFAARQKKIVRTYTNAFVCYVFDVARNVAQGRLRNVQ